MVTEAINAIANELVAWLRDWRAGPSLRVVAADWRLGENSEGDLAVYLDTMLTNPVGATWPSDDMLKLRRQVLAQLRALDFPLPVYIVLRPETEQPQDDAPAVATG